MKKETLEEEQKKERLKKAYEYLIKQNKSNRDLQAFIDSLEKKETYNGQELGLLYMVDSLNEIRSMKNKEQVKVAKEILNRYFESIPKLDKENNDIFTTYRFLSIWLSNTYYMSLAHIQQRTGKYNYLMGRVRDLYFTETAYNYFLHNVKETDKASKELTEQYQKHYIDYYKPYSLYRYTDNEERHQINKEHIQDALENTVYSYKYLLCFNKILDILAEYYKIPDLDLFKYESIDSIPAEYRHYNHFLDLLKVVLKNQITTPGTKDKKLALFKEIFKPIKYDFEIPKINIDAVKEKLTMTNYNLFANRNNDIMATLIF